MNPIQYKIEYTADKFRYDQGFNCFQPINLHILLRSLNVLTIFKPIQSEIYGVAAKIDENNFILVNSKDTIGRQNFTIAHELYHLFVQEKFSEKIETSIGSFKKDKNDLNEYYADLFASYLLLPFDGLFKLIPQNEQKKDRISLLTLITIEQNFGCSRKALLKRLELLKLITRNYAESLCDNVICNASLFGFDDRLYRPGNDNKIIGDYASIARNLYDKDIISETKYFSLLSSLKTETETEATSYEEV